MEQEVEQLKTLVGDLFSKIESLEERVSILEEEGSAKPKGPEPILTCVQCLAEYKESENAEGHCKYHPKSMNYGSWEYTYQCCNASARDREKAKALVGCSKGKHRSKHHTDYTYANYFLHMSKLSNKAKELWLSMSVSDYITERTEWAEIGLTDKGNVFVILGSSEIQPETFAEFTPEKLKKFKKSSFVALEKNNPVGWSLKAELHATNSVVDSITVSIKPASSKTPLKKKIAIVFEGDRPRPGQIETISEAYPPRPTVTYTVPEDSSEGPVLEAGPDYSKDRKKDYPTETDDDMFAVQLQQVGDIEVGSTYRDRKDNKWSNCFTATIRATNGSPNIIPITDCWGEYMNHDGEWEKVAETYVGLKGSRSFFETTDFLIDPAAPSSLVAQLNIKIPENYKEPGCRAERSIAHHSLPQPLHLRVTFEDQEKRTASLRFEQGNPPLDIPTREWREKFWSQKERLELYIFADNVHDRKRSDAAIYHDEKGILCFRHAISAFYIRQSTLDIIAFKAKNAGESEFEFSDMRREEKNPASKMAIYAMIDLDNQHAYALKVTITTPTSSATGYYLLPNEDYTGATISTNPEKVLVNSEFTVNWSVPRALKSDRIEIFALYGRRYLSSANNRQAETEGSTKMKAPGLPGEYEVRYSPNSLQGTYTGTRENTCIAVARFTVDTV